MSLELIPSLDTSLLAFLYKSCCSYAVFLKHNFQKKTLKMGLYRDTVNPSLTLIQKLKSTTVRCSTTYSQLAPH